MAVKEDFGRAMNTRSFWVLVLVACLVSRLLTQIGYIEDLDSLRFLLAIKDFDVSANRPHFPGYPVYILLLKGLYLVTQNSWAAVALAGGLSTFLLAWSTDKLAINAHPFARLCMLFMLVFSPFVWVMSTRAMADVGGLALMMCTVAFFKSSIEKAEVRSVVLFGLLSGLLMGYRLSYFPIPLVLGLFLLYKSPLRWHLIAASLLGVLIWLGPFIALEGFTDLVNSGAAGGKGHFTAWGGTVLNEMRLLDRLGIMIHHIYSHALGGWLPGRGWLTLPIGLGLALLLFVNVSKIDRSQLQNVAWKWILIALLTYVVWAWLFQNVLYKPRHILPIVPFVYLLLVSRSWPNLHSRVTLVLFCIATITLGAVLAVNHKKPSSLAQVAEYIKEKRPDTVMAPDLIQYYFDRVGSTAEVGNEVPSEGVKTVITFAPRQDMYLIEQKSFYHNPYINRMWPELHVYFYEER